MAFSISWAFWTSPQSTTDFPPNCSISCGNSVSLVKRR
jgi:hypothetical protein